MIDDFLAAHADSIRLRSQRTKVLASNIANADTPNYKARDLAFAEVLRDVSGAARIRGTNTRLPLSGTSGGNERLTVTHARHLSTRHSGSSSAPLMYRQPQQASLDGNTVDKDLEQARFAQNTVRYQASLEFIKSRVNGLITALRSQ